MKKPIIALAFLFILACKKQEIKQLNTENSDLEIQKAKNPAEYLTITNSYLTENTENIKIPNFNIEVELSEDAVKKLKEHNESFIVSLYFYGVPKVENNQLPKEINYNAQLFGLELVKKDIEIKDIQADNIVEINDLIFSRKLYDYLKSQKDISLNVNVFSGRRAFQDNILDMDSFDAPFSTVIKNNSKLILKGKLLDLK